MRSPNPNTDTYHFCLKFFNSLPTYAASITTYGINAYTPYRYKTPNAPLYIACVSPKQVNSLLCPHGLKVQKNCFNTLFRSEFVARSDQKMALFSGIPTPQSSRSSKIIPAIIHTPITRSRRNSPCRSMFFHINAANGIMSNRTIPSPPTFL